MTTPSRPSPAGRATRRSRRPTARRTSFLERNRQRIIWALGGIGVLLLAGVAFLNFTRPVYACANLFEPSPPPAAGAPTPAPTPAGTPGRSPLPGPTAPAPGFVQPDMGHQHVTTGEFVRYTLCPPASGRHWNAAGRGPIRAGVYGENETQVPQGWIHNLEHGAIVLLYKCPGPGCTPEGERELESLYGRWPASPICNTAPGGETPVITRFDDMPWPYAALVWDVVLPMETLDEARLFDFYQAYGERFNPEPRCADPTPTPGPATPTPAGTAPAGSAPAGTAPAGSAPASTPAGTAPAGSAPAASPAPASS